MVTASPAITPVLHLKPVPEIVRPGPPTTRRPHTFVRSAEHSPPRGADIDDRDI